MDFLHQLDTHSQPDDCRRPFQAGKRGVVVWIEQPIHLGAAGLELRGHFGLGDILLLHSASAS